MVRKTNIFVITILLTACFVSIIPGALAERGKDLYPLSQYLEIFEDIWGNTKARCKVHNGGDQAAYFFRDLFFTRPSPSQTDEKECWGGVSHIVLGAGSTKTDTSDSIYVDPGNYEVIYIVDYDDSVQETNENNNVCSDIFYIG